MTAGQDALVRAGLPLVQRIALGMSRRLPPSVDVDDLVGAGTVGLLQAVARYDPQRCPLFEPYAMVRIRGAILDELRTYDSLTRYGRARMRLVTKTVNVLQQSLGRQPTEDEIAERLGLTLEQYQRTHEELMRGPMLQGNSSVSAEDAESDAVGLETTLFHSDQRRRLTSAIGALSARERKVLALYYEEELTQVAIGQTLGITESRVCQILSKAYEKLRVSLSLAEVTEGTTIATAKDFANEIGVSPALLMNWKFKLKQMGKLVRATEPGPVASSSEPAPVVQLVSLDVQHKPTGKRGRARKVDQASADAGAAGAFELVFGNGMTLRVAPDFDETALSRLVRVLGGP